MEDRIQINGVWYIKENTIVQPTISQLEPGTKYDGICVLNLLINLKEKEIKKNGELMRYGIMQIGCVVF